MPTDRELLQQALDALKSLAEFIEGDLKPSEQKAIEALRARLAQPEPHYTFYHRLDAQPEPNKKDILRIRQEEWRKAQQISKDYIDDPECCFALGFDAGYGAVAQKVEPSVTESGGGFESLPASPRIAEKCIQISDNND